MDFDSPINRERIDNVDDPTPFVGLRILLIDDDTTSLSNMAAILEEYSFKVTRVKQATIALSILRKQIDQFDLVMLDVNMLEMNYLDFMKSTQLIKDIPIIVMSSEVKSEMAKNALAQGACFIFTKPTTSSMKLIKNIWRHVDRHRKKANEKSQHNKANQVEAMDNTSCAIKWQDGRAKSIANSSETSEDQAIGSLIEKEEDHSLVSKVRTESPQKKRHRLKWTANIDKKFNNVVCELGEKARPRHVLERMNVPDLTKEQVAYRLQKYRSRKQEAPNVDSMNFNEGHHSDVLNSNDFSMNISEPLEAYIPQPLEVSFIAPPNPNDYSLSWWNGWDDFLDNVPTSTSQNP
ncbi:unnamed protein product [Withania somnifera]